MKRSLRDAVTAALFAVNQRVDVTCTQDEYVQGVREAIRYYGAVHLDRDTSKDATLAFAYIRRLDRRFDLCVTHVDPPMTQWVVPHSSVDHAVAPDNASGADLGLRARRCEATQGAGATDYHNPSTIVQR